MHENVIIGLAVLTVFTLSIMAALYGMRLLDRERQWRPRRYGISAGELPCSFCGKVVRAEAIICRHCHHRLDESVEGRHDAEARPAGPAAALARAPQSPESQLVAAGATSFVIENEEFSKNQALAWLDNAFHHLAVKPADEGGATQAAALTETADISSSVPASRNEVAVRTVGPLSQQQGLSGQKAKSWLSAGMPPKEWVVAGGIASIALIVGGSTFLVSPSKPQVETPDDYVTFDVSERAPLYTGPDQAGARPATLSEPPSAAAEAQPVVAALPSAPIIAVPDVPAPPETVASAPANPTENSANATLDAAVKNDPIATSAASPGRDTRREDWAMTVARAIKPVQSKDLVVAVQRLVRAEGYDPGMIDGIVGPRTRRAIILYQRNGGLSPTGEIDRELLTKLNLADRTVRVVGPMGGVAAAAAKPARSAKPIVQWTK